MLQHTKGNLLTLAERGKFDIIVHGCNCQNTMGSGIAKEIRERFPSAYDVDTAYHEKKKLIPYLKLGNFTHTRVGSFTIVNAYTQYDYLPRGVDHFEYASFAVILQKLLYLYPNYDFGFPYIGMGLAGGDKDRIISMLEEFAKELRGGSATLVEFTNASN